MRVTPAERPSHRLAVLSPSWLSRTAAAVTLTTATMGTLAGAKLQEETAHLSAAQVKSVLAGATLNLDPMRKYEIPLAELGLGDRAQVERIAGAVGVATVRHGFLRLMTTDSQATGELELTQPGARVVIKVRLPIVEAKSSDGDSSANSKGGGLSIPLPPIPQQVVGTSDGLPPVPPVPPAPPVSKDAPGAAPQAHAKQPQ